MFPILLATILSFAVPTPSLGAQAIQAASDPAEAEARQLLAEAREPEQVKSLPKLDALVRRYGAASEPGLRDVVAEALARKVKLLFSLGRFDAGVEAHRDMQRRRAAMGPEGKDPFKDWDQSIAEQLYFAAEARLVNLPDEPSNPPYDALLRLFGQTREPEVAYLVASVMVNQGAARDRKGHPEAAIQLFEQVATRFGSLDDPRVYRTVNTALANQGGMLRDLGRLVEADQAYSAIEARNAAANWDGKDEGSLRALRFRGITATEQGHTEAALAFFDEALRRLENTPAEASQIISTMINRAYALGEAGRHAEALDQYQTLLDRFGDSGAADLQVDLAIVLVNRGWEFHQLGREAEALATFDDALERFGTESTEPLQDQMGLACLDKARVLQKLGKPDLALASLERGLGFLEGTQLSPRRIDLLGEKAEVLQEQGHYTEAGTAYRSAVEQIPDAAQPKQLRTRANLVNSLGYMQVLEAKQLWTHTQTRGPAVQQNLQEGLKTLRAAKAREAETEVQAMLLCNQAYALFLLGREAEAAPLMKAGLRLGGEKLYQGELEDTTRIPCPPDKGFKALVEKTWKRVKPKEKTP